MPTRDEQAHSIIAKSRETIRRARKSIKRSQETLRLSRAVKADRERSELERAERISTCIE